MKKLNLSAKTITGLAVLTALVIVLQTFGGAIVIGPVQLNFTLIPIVLGAILFGAWGGAFLGLVCGIVVLIQVICGLVPFYTLIWTGDPVATTFTCTLKTTVAGLVAGLVYNIFKNKKQLLGVFLASAIVPIINTALFIVGCLCMTNSVYALADDGNVFTFILVSLVTFNFFVELALNLVVAPAIKRVIEVINKSVGTKK